MQVLNIDNMNFELDNETLSILNSSAKSSNRKRNEIPPRGSVYLQLGRVLKYKTVRKFIERI